MARRSATSARAGGEGGPRQRQLRVGEVLRHALSDLLMRGDLRDPAIAEASITVTEVRMSPDLRNATVFVYPLAGSDTETVIAGLTRASPYLGGQLARMTRLKFAPRLAFRIDESFDQASRIASLLQERDAADDESDDEDRN